MALFVVLRELLVNYVESACFVVFLHLCLGVRSKERWLLPLICLFDSFVVYGVNQTLLPYTVQLPIFLAMNVLVAIIFFNGGIWDRLTCGCIGVLVPSVGNSVVTLFLALSSNTAAYQSLSVPNSPDMFRLILQIIYLPVCGVVYWYMHRSRKAFIRLPQHEAILVIISFLVCVLQSMLAQQVGMEPNLPQYYGHFVSDLLISSSCFVFFIIWLQLTIRVYSKRSELEMQKQQFAREQAHLADMQSSYLALRNWRHDYHNHLSIINYYVKQEDCHSLREYLGELNQQFPLLPMAVNTGHSVFNALMNTKMLLAAQSGADLQVEAELPKSLPIDDVSLCALLGNLLDNALEAVKRLPADAKPWIRVSARLSADAFELHVVNSADGTYHFLRDHLLSRKEEPNHGLGLMRVKQIVHTLGGKLTLTPERDTFDVLVQIPCAAQLEA